MGFRVDFDELCELGFAVQSKVTGWGDQLTAVQSALESLTGLASFRGGGAEAVKAYVGAVHGVILVSLGEILAELSTRFLLFKDGYHQVDADAHAKLDESTLDDLSVFYAGSRVGFEDAHRRVQMAAASVADLVSVDVQIVTIRGTNGRSIPVRIGWIKLAESGEIKMTTAIPTKK